MNRSFLIVIVALFCPLSATAQPPTLSHAVPGAIAPGKSTDVTFFGGNLAGATGLWSSQPFSTELATGIEQNGQKPGEVVYRFHASAETPLGIFGVRVATGKGTSNVRLLMVDDLPSVNRSGANTSREAAQVIPLPCAVDGNCNPEQTDFYKFTVPTAQRVSLEVVARRLGSPLDPVMRLFDASGRQLGRSDDEPGIPADCRLALDLAAGDYVVEVRDIRYQGGGSHRYRLRLGNFPLPTGCYPLAVQKGTTASVQPLGQFLGNAAPVGFAPAAQAADGPINLTSNIAGGQGSSWASPLVTSVAEQTEKEPNDTPETATPVAFSGGINGRLEQPGDRDWYQFEAKANQRFVLSGQTRTLGSPSDLFLRLYKPDGSVQAEIDDVGADEGTLDVTFPIDGVYKLRVEDVARRGGPQHAYRINVAPYRPGFSLALEADKFDVPQQGVLVAKVTCARRDYKGPITLSIAGAGEGFVLQNNVIPDDKNETTMSVTLPPALKSGTVAAIQVVGQAKIGESDVRAVASTLVPLRKELGTLPYPPAGLDGNVGLGIAPVFPDYFQLVAAPTAMSLPQGKGPTTFKIQLTKANGFDDKVTLAVAGLPAGVAAKVPAIEKGQTEATIELSSAEAIPPGKYAFQVTGSAVFQNQPRTVTLAELMLESTP